MEIVKVYNLGSNPVLNFVFIKSREMHIASNIQK